MATAPKAAPNVTPIEEGAAASDSAPKKSKKKLIMLAALPLILAGGAGGTWYFMGSETDPDAKPAPAAVLPPVYMQIDQFTVNLQPEVGEQYLQLAFTLQVNDQVTVEQIKLYMPLVRSRILMLLSGKKPSDINTPQGKQQLQEDILAALREPLAPGLPETSVTGVLFTAFVIQ